MAVVKIGQIRKTLGKAIAYVSNAHKTAGRTLVSSNAVLDPTNAAGVTRAFEEVQRLADSRRTVGKRPTVVGVHVIQSFRPGEVGPEQAHQIGVDLVEKITGGEYQYVVATHVDRHHIHNHIIFNPCSMTTLRRWRSPRGRLRELRAMSDELCRAHGLSVIERPGRGSVSLGEVYARVRGASTKENLRALIDDAVSCSASMSQLRERLMDAGVEVEARRGSLLVRDTETMGRAVRSERLGVAYSQPALMARLGREARREFIVAKSMVENHDEHNVVVRADALGQGAGLVVSRADLVDNGNSFRMFLSESHEHQLIDREGRTGGTVDVERIAEAILTPMREVPVPYERRSERVARGGTQAQRRYFAVVDRKVEALRRSSEEINIGASLDSMTPDQLRQRSHELTEQSRLGQRRIASLIVERQKAVDRGAKDAEIAAIDRRIDSETDRVRRIEKERTMAQRKRREKEGRGAR